MKRALFVFGAILVAFGAVLLIMLAAMENAALGAFLTVAVGALLCAWTCDPS